MHFILFGRKGFEYKTKPNDQVRLPSARLWRKCGEEIEFQVHGEA